MADVKLRPIGDKIILQAKKESVTKGGLVLPDTAEVKPQVGTVIAVGKGKVSDDGKVIPMDIKEGDTVLFAKYSPTEIEVDGKEYLVISESDVLAIVK